MKVSTKVEDACLDASNILTSVSANHPQDTARGAAAQAARTLPTDPAALCRLVFTGDIDGGLTALARILLKEQNQ